MLVVEAKTGERIGDRHIEIVPRVGRIGTRVRCREYKEVGGVQHPSEVTHTYPIHAARPVRAHVRLVRDEGRSAGGGVHPEPGSVNGSR